MKITRPTLHFLEEIEKNNNKTWFETNKSSYVSAQEEVKTWMKAVEERLNRKDEIERHKLFRIYRDVRFSKDKTPYKNRFTGFFARAGASRRGGYYMRIEPGNTIIGGGFYGPNKEDLFRLRKEFEQDRASMDTIVNQKQFKSLFGQMHGDQVKTAPKGFDKEHPHIDWIRMKQWYVQRRFTDKEVLSSDFLEEVEKTYKGLRPFFDYFTELLITDLNGESVLK